MKIMINMLFPKNYQKVKNNNKNLKFYKFSKFLIFYSINNIRYFLKNEEYVLIKKRQTKKYKFIYK